MNAERLTEEQIGFVLAPRLNALGRLGDANPAVELLSTLDVGRARLLALELEGLNSRRQLLTSQVLRAALAQIEQEPALLADEALVLAHPAWPAGVIGIVASRLVELLGKPTVLIAIPPGEDGRGSARSVEGSGYHRCNSRTSPFAKRLRRACYGGGIFDPGGEHYQFPPRDFPKQWQPNAQLCRQNGLPASRLCS